MVEDGKKGQGRSGFKEAKWRLKVRKYGDKKPVSEKKATDATQPSMGIKRNERKKEMKGKNIKERKAEKKTEGDR